MTGNPPRNYDVIIEDGVRPIKAWTRGVEFESKALDQVKNVARLPFIHKHVAVMPDVHWGKGATIGSVIATKKAVIPAAVGVDIGCGMIAARTTLRASDLPDSLDALYDSICAAVPHGTSNFAGHARGQWSSATVGAVSFWHRRLKDRYDRMVEKHPGAGHRSPENQLCTLGGGNHFIEICLDEEQAVWVMIHSGSRGAGGRIGAYFIAKAKEETKRWFVRLPDEELAYLPDGLDLFTSYWEAMTWAQEYASVNRTLMLLGVLDVMRSALPDFSIDDDFINIHHNYCAIEHHFGENVYVTRKGAVRAREGDDVIIPSSMGTPSIIGKGLGNPESFHSCSHGSGRRMSRTKARASITEEQLRESTAGVTCRKDDGVLDEAPGAYKDLDAVLAAEQDLVKPVHRLKQVLCVKGES